VRTPRSGTRDRVDTPAGQPEDEANVFCGVLWTIYNELHEKPLAESRGLFESVETEQEKIDRESTRWLLGLPQKKRTLNPDEIDVEAIADEIAQWEEEFEMEKAKEDTAKDVVFKRGW
jgi:hypothetical protein